MKLINSDFKPKTPSLNSLKNKRGYTQINNPISELQCDTSQYYYAST